MTEHLPEQNATPHANAHANSKGVRDSLQGLIDDPGTPSSVRQALRAELDTVRALIDKLDAGQIHLSVFGRVSVGKSSLLNALLGTHQQFAVGPLHGVTQQAETAAWQQAPGGGVQVFDTPGIDEIDGEARSKIARDVAARSDLVLFVCDSDLTALERQAVAELAAQHRPLLVVLNKTDRYTTAERDSLLEQIREHVADWVPAKRVLAAQAAPAPQTVIVQAADGSETESRRPRVADVTALRESLWSLLEQEGQALAAVGAGLFAGQVSDDIARRMADLKRDAADRIVRGYCMAKGVAVALNPVPVADLAAAAALDVGLVVHLSRVYGLPITRHEAGKLVGVIFGQLALLMGAVWAVHTVSSVLKGLSAGLSTAVTAIAQGSVAWYATYVVGQVAKQYFVAGKSWGPGGPKRAVQAVLDTVDKDSVLRDAKQALKTSLNKAD